MATIATAPRTEAPEIVLSEPIRAFIQCDRCGAPKTPGLTFVTAWGVLCGPCHGVYETAHGAGGEGF